MNKINFKNTILNLMQEYLLSTNELVNIDFLRPNLTKMVLRLMPNALNAIYNAKGSHQNKNIIDVIQWCMRREVAEVAKSADLEHIRVYFRLKEKKKSVEALH